MASVLSDPRQKTVYMAPILNNQGIKLGLWLQVITEAKMCTFWPRPNMPRFQTRGKM